MTVRKNEAEAEGDAADPTHRLTDIEVDEVSLVDRAANGRRYTVVKAADGEDKDDEEPEAGYKADGDKADDKGDEAEAGKAEGEDAGDKADDAPDSAEKAEPEDEDPAEGEAAAEGDDEPEEEEADKAGAPAHAALAGERLAALKGDVEAMLAMAATDPDKASEIYWRAHRHLSAYRDLVDVAAVAKADTTAARAVLDPLLEAVNAEIAKAEGDEPGEAPAADPMAAAMEMGAAILTELKTLNGHFAQAQEAAADKDAEGDDAAEGEEREAQAKAATAKTVEALGALRARVAKLERVPGSPNSRGSARAGAERGGQRPPEDGWPEDINS